VRLLLSKALIHPTAIIDPRANLAENVRVGAFSIIGADVKIGSGTIIESHVVVKGHTSLGKDNHIYQFAKILKIKNMPMKLRALKLATVM
jgi:acyl-[acyl carrier protein]--UDP-N-acetylglucosamine O-acyltransferase